MNKRSIDFIENYKGQSVGCLYDAFVGFADGCVSVYYADQFQYYKEHTQKSEDALVALYGGVNIGELLKNDTLYHLCCKAGVCGWYDSIISELYEDEDEIRQALEIEE